jgi:alpha-D-ribose 1-methylphosphonate 5-triphosphate synthase subunit PhnH
VSGAVGRDAARGGDPQDARVTAAPSWDAVHDGRTAFRACLRAMCAPGEPVAGLPRAGICGDPLLDRAAALLLALLDPGLGLAVAGGAEARACAERLARATGAAPAPLCDADFVLVTGGPAGPAREARRGSALAPEAGATLVYAGDWPPHEAQLAGPGIEAERLRAALALPPGELALLAEAAAAPPAGVDAFVLSPTGLTALPRSVARTAT